MSIRSVSVIFFSLLIVMVENLKEVEFQEEETSKETRDVFFFFFPPPYFSLLICDGGELERRQVPRRGESEGARDLVSIFYVSKQNIEPLVVITDCSSSPFFLFILSLFYITSNF